MGDWDSTIDIVLTAVSLVLVIEGITPFLSPNYMRQLMLKIAGYSDKILRIGGFVLMLVGVILMFFVHSGAFD